MSDKELIEFVKEFRKGILGRSSPAKKCFMVCSPLVTLLNMSGIDCQLKQGYIAVHEKETIYWNHYWIELFDGRILDPTASQFKNHDGSNMPVIYFGEKTSRYMKSKKKSQLEKIKEYE